MLPHFNPSIFGGDAVAGWDEAHLLWTAAFATLGLGVTSFLGRGIRHVLDGVLRRGLEAQHEVLRAHADRARELAALSGEIAHELKNPLASIKGLAALLAEDAPPGKPSERLAVLRREVDRMQTILEEFLNFSRPLVPLAIETVNLRALLGEVAEMHEGTARERDVRLAVEAVEQPVRCDPRKIKQAVINLVQNAIEASPAGGMVEIDVERGEPMRVRVLDRGPGIEPGLLGQGVRARGDQQGARLGARPHHRPGLAAAARRRRDHRGAPGRWYGGDHGAARPGGHGVKPRVLVVDDDQGIRYTLREILESSGLEVDEAADGEAALARFAAAPADLVITDLRMPKLDGMGLLARLQAGAPVPRVVMITAHGSERQAVAAMQAGAFDYFRKPFEMEELLAVVRRAVESTRLALENEKLRCELSLSRSMVFTSEAMRRLALLAGRAAPRDVTVLISGESGTGKERLAESIVAGSRRAGRPFVRFNCAALSPELAEAELFGHARGAFTGAVRSRGGLFGEADTGTILLDEIGELAQPLQAKLLRALQSGEIRAVGEPRERKVDVRVLAATNADLEAEVKRGRFREDLFYRLHVVHLRVPPLRERPEDVPLLVRHFLDRFAERFGTSPIANAEPLLSRLLGRPWPGNVRELENTIERLVALSPDGQLDLALLGGDGKSDETPSAFGLRERVEAYERGLIVEALRGCRGNRSEAARRLGLSRATLHDKLKKHGIASGEGTEE